MRLLIICLLLLTSCGSKKVINQTKEVIKNDTIVVTKDRIITKAIRDSIIIESPCDSLGILKPFKQRLRTAQGNITVESKNNEIRAEINLDSIVNSIQKEYKSKTTNTNQNEKIEIVRYKTPFWLITTLAISILLNLALLKIK